MAVMPYASIILNETLTPQLESASATMLLSK
jgi:hypothetical protein